MQLKNKDQFANRFAVRLGTVNNTIGFAEVPTYASAFSKEAFLLHKISYHLQTDALDVLVANADEMTVGITTSNKITTITNSGWDCTDPAIIDIQRYQFALRGAAASFEMVDGVRVSDFTSLPGGGILVPARPIYVCGQSLSVGAANYICSVVGWFTRMELSSEQFLELVDAYRVIS